MKLRSDEIEYNGCVIRAWKGAGMRPHWHATIRKLDDNIQGPKSACYYFGLPTREQAFTQARLEVNEWPLKTNEKGVPSDG